MTDTMQNIGMKQIRKLLPEQIESELGDDLFIITSDSEESLIDKLSSFLKYPLRSDAYMAVFCKKGEFEVDVDLVSHKITENSLFISVPGNIIKLKDDFLEEMKGLEVVIIAISQSFLSEVSFDVSKIFNDKVNIRYNPVVQLDEMAVGLCSRYVTLVEEIIKANYTNKRETVGAIVASLFYLFSGFMNSRKESKSKELTNDRNSTVRVKLLFERFMKLVSEYHNTERGMAFYANNLGLTPKYLSKLIKQASGRSAPEWIDSFVILEAKNMLKYTDDSIKEIVYKLNFPNPSVFYKFFKAHTGMTPSEYRNS